MTFEVNGLRAQQEGRASQGSAGASDSNPTGESEKPLVGKCLLPGLGLAGVMTNGQNRPEREGVSWSLDPGPGLCPALSGTLVRGMMYISG